MDQGDGATVIAQVDEGELAYLAGLRAGDKILAINGLLNEYYRLT